MMELIKYLSPVETAFLVMALGTFLTGFCTLGYVYLSKYRESARVAVIRWLNGVLIRQEYYLNEFKRKHYIKSDEEE